MDRLSELRGAAGTVDEHRVDVKHDTDGEQSEISRHAAVYEGIKQNMDSVKKSTAELTDLRVQMLRQVRDSGRQAILDRVATITAQTSGTARSVRETLDRIKGENAQYKKQHQNAATTQIRLNLYQTHIRKFHSVMTEYNQVANEFKTMLKERNKRQLGVVNPNLSEEQVEELVDSGRAEEAFKQAVLSDDMEDAIREIEEQYKSIRQLEQQVLEIHEMFVDLASLVSLQQDTLDVITQRIAQAKDYTADATKELRQGEEYQKKARRRTCCLLMLVLAAAIAILAPILSTQLGNA